MKKNIVIVLALIIIGNLQAQTIKTYSGDLDNGKVTFSYYEDSKTGNEIRHGIYKYVHLQNGDYGSKYLVTISGSYKNGYRNGIWNYAINKTNCSDGSNQYYTGVTAMIQTYSDGMPNGLWSYSENYQVRSQKYSTAGWSWGLYKSVAPQNIVVNFCNGILCGSLKINTTYEKIIGQFSDNGWWTGNWNINSNTEFTLDNGIVMKYKIRNNDGSVNSQSNFDPEMLQLLNRIKTMPKDSVEDFCRKNNLKYELVLGTKHYNVDYFDGSGKEFELRTDGDKTYVVGEYIYGGTDLRKYGRYILIEKIN